VNSLIERSLLKSREREWIHSVYYDHRTPIRRWIQGRALNSEAGFVKELSMGFMVSLTDSSAL
jgi:hypothetical protein